MVLRVQTEQDEQKEFNFECIEFMTDPSSTKVVPIIKCTFTVFIDNFGNMSTNSSI